MVQLGGSSMHKEERGFRYQRVAVKHIVNLGRKVLEYIAMRGSRCGEDSRKRDTDGVTSGVAATGAPNL
jgi:hypothetical protein